MARPDRPVVGAVTWPCCRCCTSGVGQLAHDGPYRGHEHVCAFCQADQLVIGVGE